MESKGQDGGGGGDQTQPIQIESVEVVPMTTDSLATLQRGDTAAVEVTWTNPNENEFATFTQDVYVNGNRVGTIDTETFPGYTDSKRIQFTVGGPGTYEVSVDGQSTTVEIGGQTGNGDNEQNGQNGGPDQCTSDDQCAGQLVCRDGRCVQPTDGARGLSTTALLALGGGGAALLTILLATQT